MIPTAWKRTAVLASVSAAILILAPAAVSAGSHPHYLPPQISSYPSAEAPSSGQSSEQEAAEKEDHCQQSKHTILHRTIPEKEISMTGGPWNDNQL